MTLAGPTHHGAGAVVGHFYERTGIEFSPIRQHSIINGVGRAMSRAGIGDEAEFLDRLKTDESAFDDLVAELTVGETYFLRVPQQFAFIRERILPEVRANHGAGHAVRAWSCGCSTGEEPYSLAMVFAEEGVSDESHLLATDISREALRKAGAARYTNWSFRNTEAALRARYFHEEDGRYALNENVRSRVDFRYLNLAADVYPSFHTDTWGMNLILCRNVMIYLSPAVIERVCRQLFDCLVDGGWLITAPTDPPIDRIVPCEVVMDEGGLYYRKRGSRALSVVRSRPLSRPEVACPLPVVIPRPSQPMRKFKPQAVEPEAERVEPVESPAKEAEALLAAGEYERALESLAEAEPSATNWALRLRALANVDLVQAVDSSGEVVDKYPLSIELTFLRAMLLMHVRQLAGSVASLRRAIYLDPSFALGHFMLGTLLQQTGDKGQASRSYRNARDLCLACPPEEELPLAEGETAGRLATVIETQMALLAS